MLQITRKKGSEAGWSIRAIIKTRKGFINHAQHFSGRRRVSDDTADFEMHQSGSASGRVYI